jgi:uncharacterized protein YukE
VTDYRVAPQALRDMAGQYQDAGDQWQRLVAVLDGAEATLADRDLGLLGQWSGFVGTYNDARTAAIKELEQGQQALSSAGDALSDVARHYEDKEFEYYREFGYVKEKLKSKPGGNQQERSR